MREFNEPTCRNLLSKPTVMGVAAPKLLALGFIICLIQVLGGAVKYKDQIALAIGVLGYLFLRIEARFSKPGSEERFYFWLEKLLLKPSVPSKALSIESLAHQVVPPDTLDEIEALTHKMQLEERLQNLEKNKPLIFFYDRDSRGVTLSTVASEPQNVGRSLKFLNFAQGLISEDETIFSLVSLPAHTDPFFMFRELQKADVPLCAFIRIDGLNQDSVKKSLEGVRRRSSEFGRRRGVEEEISFNEASRVLEGLIRGDDQALQFSMIIVTPKDSKNPNPAFWLREKDRELPLLSASGIRRRPHRSHIARLSTVCDFIADIGDPRESRREVLLTPRMIPCTFNPLDQSLEALHWLVVGASGSGKSFFTGLILKRLVDRGEKLSVIFLDHNRSFKRLVRSRGCQFFEPQSYLELESSIPTVLPALNTTGTLIGIELSDLSIKDKKQGASAILREIGSFLKFRKTTHPVYVVLDECWNFLRDDPEAVQRAFREFRKLNGAAIAITQSLSDFLRDESGESIFQNAPIRILLRQGEDLSAQKERLSLNDVELKRARFLRQEKGVFSECLIKTPHQSRIGRLYPTESEHNLLRTDNLRSEIANA